MPRKCDKTAICQDCGDAISRRSIRCKPCFDKSRTGAKRTCKNCSSPISVQSGSGKCKPCWAKGRRKPMPSCEVCKKTLSARHVSRCRPCAIKGGANPNFKGLKRKKCPCGADFSVEVHRKKSAKYCSLTCKHQYSVSKIKVIKYKDLLLRSSWEVAYAKYLDLQGYRWEYEPKAFETPYGFYIPDFWVHELRSYVEVKGWFRKDAKLKFGSFKEVHPIILADGKYLKSLGFQIKKTGPVWGGS